MLGKLVTILIDNGSTHNFINQKKAANISLPITHPIPFVVQVANGANIKCPRICDDVPIHIQGFCFTNTLYMLLLVGIDLVLAIQWLESLGLVCDWRPLTMNFNKDGCDFDIIGQKDEISQLQSL